MLQRSEPLAASNSAGVDILRRVIRFVMDTSFDETPNLLMRRHDNLGSRKGLLLFFDDPHEGSTYPFCSVAWVAIY